VKKITRKFIHTIGLLFFFFFCYSQQDTCNLRISLLTCSPGEELYSSWGHTAIRVTDRNTAMDMVFNYGTFDDSDPNFYLRFTRGIMYYALSAYPFVDFLDEYRFQGRGIIEQILEMPCAAKDSIFKALQINNTDENRFYSYYFHTDNCTTRAEDIIINNIGTGVIFKNILPSDDLTFRHLIHAYLDNNQKYWSKFGIDLFLGINLDKKMTNKESRFLPDYLKKGFDSAYINKQPLVQQSNIIIDWPQQGKDSLYWFTPFVVFTILLVIVGALSLSRSSWACKALLIFDSIFFFVIGLLGVLMLTLWIIRIDTVCRNNFNILWALPTHIFAAFFLRSSKAWVQKYFQITFWIGIVLAFTWFFIPQQLNNAIGPIVLLIIIRSYHYGKKTHDGRKDIGNRRV
jgi:hypothetical protein